MQRIVVSSLVLGLLALVSVGASHVSAADCGGAGPACNCGDTVIADHTLPGPLTCDGNGLIVAPGIVLDLGGHDFTGTDKTGVGVQLNTGSQVINGRIQNFGVGIGSAGLITSCLIGDGATKLVVTINTTGIGLDADTCRIDRATIVANDAIGVSVTGDGNALVQLACSRNGAAGIAVTGDNNVLTLNRCELNDTDGIVVNGNSNTLDRNLATRNDQSGIIATGGGNVFKRNQGRLNAGDGVRGIRSGAALQSDGKNYGTGNGGVDCSIDGFPTRGGRYC